MKSSPLLVSAESSSACLALSCTCREAGTSGCTALTSCADEVPSFAWIEMPSQTPSLCSRLRAVSGSKIAIVAPPSESTSPNVAMPVTS